MSSLSYTFSLTDCPALEKKQQFRTMLYLIKTSCRNLKHVLETCVDFRYTNLEPVFKLGRSTKHLIAYGADIHWLNTG